MTNTPTGQVWVSALLESARDLIEHPEHNPEYTRGILELLNDVTGWDKDELAAIIWPQEDPFTTFVTEQLGGPPDTVADWQSVARELWDRLDADRRRENNNMPERAAWSAASAAVLKNELEVRRSEPQ